MKEATLSEMEELQWSDEYSEYIMANSPGDRMIGNGDMLIETIEDGYLFDDFCASKGFTLP
jgi:hypothetical protein